MGRPRDRHARRPSRRHLPGRPAGRVTADPAAGRIGQDRQATGAEPTPTVEPSRNPNLSRRRRRKRMRRRPAPTPCAPPTPLPRRHRHLYPSIRAAGVDVASRWERTQPAVPPGFRPTSTSPTTSNECWPLGRGDSARGEFRYPELRPCRATRHVRGQPAAAAAARLRQTEPDHSSERPPTANRA